MKVLRFTNVSAGPSPAQKVIFPCRAGSVDRARRWGNTCGARSRRPSVSPSGRSPWPLMQALLRRSSNGGGAETSCGENATVGDLMELVVKVGRSIKRIVTYLLW